MSKFNERFRELKDESELSAKELSTLLDIAPSTLSYYLKDREPNYDMLIKIADYFHVTTDWLIGRSDARSSVYEALDNEVINTIVKNEVSKITANDVDPLTIFKKDYAKIQEKFVELLSFYYTVLHKLEELENLHPEIDYTLMNDSLFENIIEAIEYQIDIAECAQYALLSPTPNMLFEYYFNSLLRIDLVLHSYKLAICSILEFATTNFDGNGNQIATVVDFIQQAKKHASNSISDIELSSYFERMGM